MIYYSRPEKPSNNYDLFNYNNPYVEFYDNGNKRIEVEYKNSIKHGSSKSWYVSGQIEEQATFIDGKLDGEFTSWHENGAKHIKENYCNGELDGNSIHWHDNGQKSLEADFLLGELNGVCTSWHSDGSLINESVYENGAIKISMKHNEESDNIQPEANDIIVKDGLAYQSTLYTGRYTSKYKNGNTYTDGYYDKGLKESNWIEFYKNGNKKSDGNYLNGKREGIWLEYCMDKQHPKEIYYKNGVRQLTKYPAINYLVDFTIPLGMITYFVFTIIQY